MHDALDNQLFLGFQQIAIGDRAVAVPAAGASKAGAVAECVHQPRLALRLRPQALDRFWQECLPGFLRVLSQQGLHFGARKVAEPQ